MELFGKIKSFLEEKPASHKAVRHLKKGVEIGIILDGKDNCAYFHEDGRPRLEKRPAKSPDVIFHLKAEAVEALCSHSGEDVGEFGVAVVKQYAAKNLRIQAPGNIFSIGRNGYLGVIAEGGGTFMKFLANYGLTNIPKILSAIGKLRRGE